MEERLCPRCKKAISEEDKICSDCGMPLLPQREARPISLPAKRRPLEGGLLVEILIIVGFVALGTLAIYSLASIMSSGDWSGFFEKVTAASIEPALSAKPDGKANQQPLDKTFSDLPELPSTAPANAYMALQQDAIARHDDGSVVFIFTLENISDAVCSGAGIEVALYDAASNCVGSNSFWVYRNIQPGERVQLVFGGLGGPDVRAFCVTKIGGQPDAVPLSATQALSGTSAVADGRSFPVRETPLDEKPLNEKPAERETAPVLSEKDVSLPHGLTLLDGAIEQTKEGYRRQFQGRVRNDSKIKYHDVRIKLVIYDEKKNLISTTVATTKDFEPETVWVFSAPVVVPSDQIAKYGIKSVSVH